MYYSDLYTKDKRAISVSLFVAAFIAVIGMFVFITKGSVSTPSRASLKNLLKNQIVNLSPTQSGIFWQTDKSEVGWIIYGNDKNMLTNIAIDERDVEDNKKPYKFHYVVLRNLEENTTYYYKIVTLTGIYSEASDYPFTFSTPKNIQLHSTLEPVYGTIIQQNSMPLDGSFIILNIDQLGPLLTMTKSKGEFLIPLAYFVDSKTNSLVLPANDEVAVLTIINNEGSSSIKARLNQLTPLSQSVIFGKNYNFTENSSVLSASTHVSELASGNNTFNQGSLFSILYPKENSVVPSQFPLIKGTGIPGEEIIVSINSLPQYNTRTTVTNDGVWVIQPSLPIAAGTYTITITSIGANGTKRILSRVFSIAKSGEEVLGEATVSASITPSLVPTVQPTAIETTPIAQNSTTSPTPPRTGMDNTIPVVTSTSLIVIGVGLLLVF